MEWGNEGEWRQLARGKESGGKGEGDISAKMGQSAEMNEWTLKLVNHHLFLYKMNCEWEREWIGIR